MNLFVPDARIGWYFSAVIGGRTLIEKERPNCDHLHRTASQCPSDWCNA
jgi:hypothetical protein